MTITNAVIREMGLRDGLQSIARTVPTAAKLEWIRLAYEAGQREIEVGSFVPARLLPQLADTAELLAYAQTLPGLKASVLVPNLKGAERAMECGAELMLVPLSASHLHSLANLRKTPDEVVADIARIRAARDATGSRTKLEVGISTAFGCTIQGHVDPAEVMRLVQAVLDAGVDAVSLADTVGYADPAMVRALFERVLPRLSDRQLAQWLQDAHVVDGIVKGLKQPDWPASGWQALHRLALDVCRACMTGPAARVGGPSAATAVARPGR